MPATEAEKEQTKTLWKQGFTATEIAKRLGFSSRSTVSGIVYRAGLSHTEREVREVRTVAVRPPPRFVPKPPPIVAEPPPPPPIMRKIKLLNLKPKHCRWPVGNPRGEGFFFCGADKVDGSSYCRHHKWLGSAGLPKRK